MKTILTILFFAVSTSAQVSLVAHTVASSPNGAAITTGGLDTTGCTPHCMEAVCYVASVSGTPSNPITDSLTNTWLLAKKQNEDGDLIAELWVSFGPTTGAAQTFTAMGLYPALAVAAYSGVASGPDQTNSDFSNVSGSITPSNADELLISCLGTNNASASSVNSPFILTDQHALNAGNAFGVGSGYQVQTTATAESATWTNSTEVATLIASFYSTLAPAPLVAITTTLPEGFNGSTYSGQLASSGGVSPFTWSLTSGTLPTGLSSNSAGTISGTPTQTILNTPLTFKVTDSQSSMASTSGLTMTIAATALSITTTTCPSGTQAAAYSGCTIAATGGTSPYTFSNVNSASYPSIPEGLALNGSTGAITSAQIGGQGTYIPALLVTDSKGATAQQAITFSLTGSNAFLSSIFPSNSIFHHRVDAATTSLPVDASPAGPIPSIYLSTPLRVGFGSDTIGGYPDGIPAFQVPYNQSNVPVTTTLYQSYFTSGPFPPNAPIESTANGLTFYDSDSHVLIYQQAGGGDPPKLWEMWQGINSITSWSDSSNALWSDVTSNALTPVDGGTTDAAGLPVAPLLVNADEVIGTGSPSSPNGTIQHPIRLTYPHGLNYNVWPATTQAGLGTCKDGSGFNIPAGRISQSAPPVSCTEPGAFGEIYRLQASFSTPSCASTSPQANIIITALRNYGMIMTDNGLAAIIGTPDTRWNESDLVCLINITLGDFEPVNVSSLIIDPDSGQTPGGSSTGASFSNATLSNSVIQ